MGQPLTAARVRPRPLYFIIGVLIALLTVGGFLFGLAQFILNGGHDLFDSSSVFMSTSSTDARSLESLPPAQIALVNMAVNSSLTSDRERQLFRFDITRPGQVTLQLHSDFDNYLELYDSSLLTRLASDDDSGEGRNARLNITLGPGSYNVLVRPFSSGSGPFTLLILAPSETATQPPTPPPAY